MAFGSTGVLDNFNRGTGIGANWSRIWSGDSPLDIASSTLVYSSQDGAYANGGWNPATFGADCEVYLTLATVDTNTLALYARMSALNTAGGPNGYRLLYNGNGTWYIDKLTSGAGMSSIGIR